MRIVKYIIAGIVHTINFLIAALGFALRSILFFLPDSPFQSFIQSLQTSDSFMSMINYVLPLDQMIVFMQVWIVAVASYYMYTVILRYFKVVE